MTLVVATYYEVPLVFVLTAWYQFVNVLSVSRSEIFLKLRCFFKLSFYKLWFAFISEFSTGLDENYDWASGQEGLICSDVIYFLPFDFVQPILHKSLQLF